MVGSVAGFSKTTQCRKYVIHIDHAVAITVGVDIIRTPGRQDVDHIVGIDEEIAGGIAEAIRAFIGNGVASIVVPVSIDLIEIITTDNAIHEEADAAIKVDMDPTTFVRSPVVQDGAPVKYCNTRGITVDATPRTGSVIQDLTADDVGIATEAVDSATFVRRVLGERAICDSDITVKAADAASALVGLIVRDHAV